MSTSTHYIKARAAEILRDPRLLPLTALACQLTPIEAQELVRFSPGRAQAHIENYLTTEREG